MPDNAAPRTMARTMLGALGIVFGDIGTSPIYTLRESFKAAGPQAGIGVLSLVAWTIMVVVTVKYVILVMRADNDGEGGIVALASTVLPAVQSPRARAALALLGIAGAALFYGDGMITPAISVLSAVEGLEVATPAVKPYVVPIALCILVALFLVQRRGSERIGHVFGPVMLAWFAVLAAMAVPPLLRHPEVLWALDPRHAAAFCAHAPGRAFVTLGSVFLAVTGAEALYADMGHFGRTPIRVDWLAFVLPALLLNYAGQAATVLENPATLANPFFLMLPGWALVPVVLLATLATVIASQAVLSGAFSLTQQAVQLGLLPHLEIRQTSDTARGQVYVPQVNWLLMLGVVALVLAFRSSDALAAAYGIAVTGTMVTTSVLLIAAMRTLWRWSWPAALAAGLPLLAIDLVFFAANALKIPDGGWVPLLIGGAIFLVMQTWRDGRRVVLARIDSEAKPLAALIARLEAGTIPRTGGTGIFLTSQQHTVPAAMSELLRHVGVLHETLILLTVRTERQPTVPPAGRAERQTLAPGFERVTLHFGFAEAPSLPAVLRDQVDLHIPEDANYFIGRELPAPAAHPALPAWRAALLLYLARNAVSAADYFALPATQVIELGARVEV